MPSSDLELLTVGRISIDLYCDQLGADWHAARTFQKAVGGSPTNVAIAAARLGRRAAVVTKVGEDPLGEVALAELREFGVDLRYAAVEPGTVTPVAFALLDPPEDPKLWFRRDPPVPDFQIRADHVEPDTIRAVPRAVDLGRRAITGAEPLDGPGDARGAGAPGAHDPGPRLPPELLGLARGGLGTDRGGRRPRHRRRGQPRGMRDRGRLRANRVRPPPGCSSAACSWRSSSWAATVRCWPRPAGSI